MNLPPTVQHGAFWLLSFGVFVLIKACYWGVVFTYLLDVATLPLSLLPTRGLLALVLRPVYVYYSVY